MTLMITIFSVLILSMSMLHVTLLYSKPSVQASSYFYTVLHITGRLKVIVVISVNANL